MTLDRRALVLLPFLLAATPALGDEIPNLVGTWKATAYAVHLGSNPYRPTEGTGANFPEAALEFTFIVSEQHDRRFAGELNGGDFKETFIGMLQPDNGGGIILDEDGRYDFTLRDANTIESCYAHSYPKSKVVACYSLIRQN